MVSSEMENNLGSKNVLFSNFLNLGCSRDKQEIEKPLVFKKIGEDSEKEKIHGFK